MTTTTGRAANSRTGRAEGGELPAPHVGLILALTINGLAVSNYRDLVAVSQTAEEYRFDSVWLCDHFRTLSSQDYVRDAGLTAEGVEADQQSRRQSLPLLECWTALSALARDTSRLRLGTSVLCNSYRHPSVSCGVDGAEPDVQRSLLHVERRHLRSATGPTTTPSALDRRRREPRSTNRSQDSPGAECPVVVTTTGEAAHRLPQPCV